jgi:transcriptional regulator with XRE-family HTH domain
MGNKAQINLKYKTGYGRNYANLRKEKFNKKRDFTVRELSEFLRISYPTISNIETEKRFPTVEQVYLYKNFFKDFCDMDISLDYLVGETTVISPSLNGICNYLHISENAINSILDITDMQIEYSFEISYDDISARLEKAKENAEIFEFLISPAHRYSGDIRQLIANLKQLKAESAKLMNEQFENDETFQSLELKINAISYNISLYASELISEFDEKYKAPDKYHQLRAKYQKERIQKTFDKNIRKD